MKTVTWTGKNGNAMKITIEYMCESRTKVVDLDGHKWESGTEVVTNADMIFYIDDKKTDSVWDVSFWEIIEVRNVAGYYKVRGLNAAFTSDVKALIEKAVAEAIAEGTPAEVEKVINEKKEIKKAKEIEDAKKIIADAEKQKSIPTNREYKIWAKQYNDIYNEGGSGYVPDMITKEQYDRALAIVNQ